VQAHGKDGYCSIMPGFQSKELQQNDQMSMYVIIMKSLKVSEKIEYKNNDVIHQADINLQTRRRKEPD
jgi:hypothetical protein